MNMASPATTMAVRTGSAVYECAAPLLLAAAEPEPEDPLPLPLPLLPDDPDPEVELAGAFGST